MEKEMKKATVVVAKNRQKEYLQCLKIVNQSYKQTQALEVELLLAKKGIVL